MNKQLQSDFQHFDSILDKARKQSEEYLKGFHERPVSSNPSSPPITGLPTEGLGAENALNIFNQTFDPFIVGASGPRYWGYVTGGTTPASIIGDWLDNFNYLNFLPENSQRLKALPAWFTLMTYGKEGYHNIVDGCIRLAQQFGNMLQQSEVLDLLAPVRLNNICFTLAGEPTSEQVDRFLHEVNATDKVFMTPTTNRNQRGIRTSLVNWRTVEQDLELVMNVMLSVTNSSEA